MRSRRFNPNLTLYDSRRRLGERKGSVQRRLGYWCCWIILNRELTICADRGVIVASGFGRSGISGPMYGSGTPEAALFIYPTLFLSSTKSIDDTECRFCCCDDPISLFFLSVCSMQGVLMSANQLLMVVTISLAQGKQLVPLCSLFRKVRQTLP